MNQRSNEDENGDDGEKYKLMRRCIYQKLQKDAASPEFSVLWDFMFADL